MTKGQEKVQINGTWQDVQTEEFMKNETTFQEQVLGSGSKRSYCKPTLVVLGDLRTMTLSPTLADAEESGYGTPYYDSSGGAFTTDQFERGTSRRTDSSGDSGRSGRN
jgi:hypothetical protein